MVRGFIIDQRLKILVWDDFGSNLRPSKLKIWYNKSYRELNLQSELWSNFKDLTYRS